MMKKDYESFAQAVIKIDDEQEREKFILFLIPIFSGDNSKFDEEKFRSYINKRREGK